jgi:protocatechuate 3,4-dioxygenase alpha subunit
VTEKLLGQTPSQTVGPYFAYALTAPQYGYPHDGIASDRMADDGVPGMRIRIEGRVLDGAGAPVSDAMIEIWQADGKGRYPGASPALANARFKGFGRSETIGGSWRFTTVKPGPVPGPGGRMQAPHLDVGVFARGILKRLFTRIYFDDEPGNADDPVLGLVPAERRTTLIARRDGDRDGLPRYVLDLHLQGDDETVFFEA